MISDIFECKTRTPFPTSIAPVTPPTSVSATASDEGADEAKATVATDATETTATSSPLTATETSAMFKPKLVRNLAYRNNAFGRQLAPR